MSRRRLVWGVRVAALGMLLAIGTGCSVRLRAVQLKVDVNDTGMKLIKPLSGAYAGGEVVITIVNNTSAKRQFTLVRTTSSPQNLPAHVLNALSDRDDSRVVAVTGVMRAAKIGLIFGALPQPQPTEVKLHVYLHTNTPYLLFDRLGGFRHGVALRLEAKGVDRMTDLFPPVHADHAFAENADPRASVDELGYAFLRGVLDPEKVTNLRGQLVEYVAAAGWLAEGSDPTRAEPGPVVHDDSDLDDFLPVYSKIQATQAFHELGHEPRLVGAIDEILGEPSFCFPLKMARIKFPRPRAERPPTPPHQDYKHLQGSIDTLTAWLPLDDTPAGQGRLAVAAGSHRLGLRDVPNSLLDVERFDFEWHSSDFRVGDVLVFHALAVHAAEDHPTDRLRITVDYRFQPLSEPVGENMMAPHYGASSWSELYESWSRTDLQHYWERLPVELAPYTEDRAEFVERAASKPSRFVTPTVPGAGS